MVFLRPWETFGRNKFRVFFLPFFERKEKRTLDNLTFVSAFHWCHSSHSWMTFRLQINVSHPFCLPVLVTPLRRSSWESAVIVFFFFQFVYGERCIHSGEKRCPVLFIRSFIYRSINWPIDQIFINISFPLWKWIFFFFRYHKKKTPRRWWNSPSIHWK